jgi:hypothetical protein
MGHDTAFPAAETAELSTESPAREERAYRALDHLRGAISGREPPTPKSTLKNRAKDVPNMDDGVALPGREGSFEQVSGAGLLPCLRQCRGLTSAAQSRGEGMPKSPAPELPQPMAKLLVPPNSKKPRHETAE